MKTLILLFALFAGFQFSQAAVLTVNNNNPSPGQFTTIPAAYAASSPGDTIYVHGSPLLYSQALILNLHPVTMIGPGLLPGSASGSQARISGTITIHAVAAGSKFIGLYFTGNLTHSGSGMHNITFDRCALSGTNFVVSGNDWHINRCVVGVLSGINTTGTLSYANNPLATMFSNNILITNGTPYSGVSFNTMFTNNLIINRNTSIEIINFHNSSTTQAIFDNNIALGVNLAENCPICTYENNLTFMPAYLNPSTLPDLNIFNNSAGNIIANPLLTGLPGTTDFTLFDYSNLNPNALNPVLQPGSPALTAGAGNTEIGPFGGLLPFNLSGEPDLPVVRNFLLQNVVVPAGTNLEVQFTATPNN